MNQLLNNTTPLNRYVIHLADNVLILGHRLSEWCGHGPVLEQDIAITNIALDLVGQARMYYQYAAEIHPHQLTEDDIAFKRDIWDYRNLLLTERPNGDWAHTTVRQLFFDAFHIHLLEKLLKSSDEELRAIAEKSIKEVKYHLRYSSEWTIRLGDGTTESHARMQKAVDELWDYTGEMFESSEVDTLMQEQGIAPNLAELKPKWLAYVSDILSQATLTMPESGDWWQSGGKIGKHSEGMGFILTELQWMQRTYPNMQW